MTDTHAELEKKLLSLLREITIFAHKDKLFREGEYEYIPDIHIIPSSINFHKDTMLRYDGMTVTESGGTYWLRFKTLEKLEAELIRSRMPTTFTTLLVNQKFFDKMVIDHDLNLDKTLAMSVFEDKIEDKIDIGLLTEAIANIEKMNFLSRLKYF